LWNGSIAAIVGCCATARGSRTLLQVLPPPTDPVDARVAVEELKAVQDVLGTFPDSETQREALYSLGTDLMSGDGAPVRTVFATGELAARLSEDQDTARARFAVVFERFSTRSAR
jgi:hypothetical protein